MILGGEPADIIEIASGTGQHGAAFSAAFPHVNWWPTEYDAQNLPSIEAWRAHCGHPNYQPALQLDVTSEAWRSGNVIEGIPSSANGIFCTNMVHISPWAATMGLFEGARNRLAPDGFLFVYGPYARNGQHTSEGNVQFDSSLRLRNPEWGIRNLEDVEELARSNELTLSEIIQMPANNLSLIFRL